MIVVMYKNNQDKYVNFTDSSLIAIIEEHNSKGVGNYKPFAEEFNGSSK
jgi:hypothetical protein